MKTKVLIPVLLMCVCTYLGAESVLAAIWANQKAKQTRQSPRPQRREFLADVPFNTKVERLPPSFKGDNMKRLYDTLESIPEKGEMESTAAFYDRLEKAVDYNRYYTFVDSISPEYDADQQKLSFSILTDSAWGEARKVLGGSYRASNAYGATVTVLREHYEDFGIKNFSLPLNCKGKKSLACDEYKYELTAPPERARYLQGNLRVLYIGLLHFTNEEHYKHASYTSLEVHGSEPTISSPYDEKRVHYLVNLWLEQTWLFDSATGEILDKHLEFAHRDDAHILPFNEKQLRANIVSTVTSGWMGEARPGSRRLPRLHIDDPTKPIQTKVVVGPDGKVENVGRSCWDDEVRQWRFKPFYNNGKLVRATGTLTFDPNEVVKKNGSDDAYWFSYNGPTTPGADLRRVEADLTVDNDGVVVNVDNVNCDSRIQAAPGGIERVKAILQKLRTQRVLEVCGYPVKFTVRGSFYFNSEYDLTSRP